MKRATSLRNYENIRNCRRVNRERYDDDFVSLLDKVAGIFMSPTDVRAPDSPVPMPCLSHNTTPHRRFLQHTFVGSPTTSARTQPSHLCVLASFASLPQHFCTHTNLSHLCACLVCRSPPPLPSITQTSRLCLPVFFVSCLLL